MADEVILNKVATIDNCLRRIKEEYQGDSANLRNNQTKQDSIVLNLRRACQAAIDMAMHIVRLKRLGLPKESSEAFDLMVGAHLLDRSLCKRMHGLVAFRDNEIHSDNKPDLDIVEAIINNYLVDFQEFAKVALQIQE